MTDPLRRGDPLTVGPYRLEGRLGEGGMGQVFLGTSPGGRRVAVKLIRAEHAADPDFRARFGREVEAARKVGGFHTAQVVDADADAEAPWMATAYVPGRSLREHVLGHGPLPSDEVRKLGAALAEGLTAIHAHGLVHRDLKPGNVIMSPDGPRIIDFGIARAADADSLTSDGVVLGTYAFMAPEQMRGDRAGPPADVFALGCVLAYAATGNSPFEASTVPAIVHRVLNEDPPLNGVPADIARAIAACLAKDPCARPALSLLLGHLADPRSAPLPVVPPAGDGEATLPPGTMVVTREEGARPGPAGGRRVPRRTLLAGAAAAATVVAVGGGGAFLATRSSAGTRRPDPAPSARQPIASTLTGHRRGVGALAFSPDGRLLASGSSYNDEARIWDVASARPLRALAGGVGVMEVAFSPDGRLLATAHFDSCAMLWDVATGRKIRTLDTEKYPLLTVAFSPDGRTLATGNPDVRLWDVATGRHTTLDTGPLTRGLDGPVHHGVHRLRFSPDGRTLIAALDGYGDGDDRDAILTWDTATGRKGPLTRVETTKNLTLDISPDGTRLATCGGSENISLWDLASRRVIATLSGHIDEVWEVTFGRKGTVLASCGLDRTVRLWDVASGRATAVLAGHTERLDTVVFSPDGRTVAAGGGKDDAAVRLWKVG
ncbi:WD40 repeat domain-containing serine/threonine protein kinase [Actinomadura rugatobispora]|uniref:WD40 repeat domain-containing serine/threonine protein kinase n=1 Tax=Actinomadura rugatobispora TaxID=1994 RepID=A0ABW1AIZ4_9ACTN|nr:serine/threonine-protein kinase [Actinomadura rugatobispora]